MAEERHAQYSLRRRITLSTLLIFLASIWALSANAIPRDIERGMEAGFFSYLTKPIKVREFMAALDVALRYAAENRQAK